VNALLIDTQAETTTIVHLDDPPTTANNFRSDIPPRPRIPKLRAEVVPVMGKSARRLRLEERWARKQRRGAGL
jgi:hypothetical protein